MSDSIVSNRISLIFIALPLLVLSYSLLSHPIIILAVDVFVLLVAIFGGVWILAGHVFTLMSVGSFGIDPDTIAGSTNTLVSIRMNEGDFLAIGWKVMFAFGLVVEVLVLVIPSVGSKIKQIFLSAQFWTRVFLFGGVLWPAMAVAIWLIVPNASNIGLGFIPQKYPVP